MLATHRATVGRQARRDAAHIDLLSLPGMGNRCLRQRHVFRDAPTNWRQTDHLVAIACRPLERRFDWGISRDLPYLTLLRCAVSYRSARVDISGIAIPNLQSGNLTTNWDDRTFRCNNLSY